MSQVLPRKGAQTRLPGHVRILGGGREWGEGPLILLPIQQGIEVTARRLDNDRLIIQSIDLGRVYAGTIRDLPYTSGGIWASCILNAIAVMRESGAAIRGMELRIRSDLPADLLHYGCAALLPAGVLSIAQLHLISLTSREVAILCAKAEFRLRNRFVGIAKYLGILGSRADRLASVDEGNVRSIVSGKPAGWVIFSEKPSLSPCVQSTGPDAWNQTEENANCVVDEIVHRDGSVWPDVLSKAVGFIEEEATLRRFVRSMEEGDLDEAGRILSASQLAGAANKSPLLNLAQGQPGYYGGYAYVEKGERRVINLVDPIHCENFASRLADEYLALSGIRVTHFIVGASCDLEDSDSQEVVECLREVCPA